jgi:hypothetical protein
VREPIQQGRPSHRWRKIRIIAAYLVTSAMLPGGRVRIAGWLLRQAKQELSACQCCVRRLI